MGKSLPMHPSAVPDKPCPCKVTCGPILPCRQGRLLSRAPTVGMDSELSLSASHQTFMCLMTVVVLPPRTFFFRLINCRLSCEVTFSRPLICLSACLCPLSSWATHWLRHGAQIWMQTPMKPLQCQVQWEGPFQMSCFFPVLAFFHYGVSFSCICRTFLNLVWCVWSITASEAFSLELQVANYFPQDMYSWLT